DRQDAGGVGDTRHPDAVVADGRGHAGGGGAVAVAGAGVGRRVVVAVPEVPAGDVVRPAVAVVVEAVTGDFAGVVPDVGGEVGVVTLDGVVDDGDDDVGAAGGHLPGFGGVHVGVGGAAGLAGVVQVPLLRVE